MECQSTAASTSLISCNFALSVICAMVAYSLIRAIYNIFLSPLSAIPGPWYAAVSDFWMTIHVFRLRQCKVNHELFERYGPVVRIGPKKVIFRDLSSARSIYAIQRFDKSPYYKGLLTNNNDHAMTTLDHSTHAVRRKAYAPHYVPANLGQFQPEMQEFTNQLVQNLEKIAGKESLNCLDAFRHLMVDFVVFSSFGYRLGALSKWGLEAVDPLSTAINDFPIRGIVRSTLPAWFWNLICGIPSARWRQLCDSDKIMAEFVSARVYEMRAQSDAGKVDDAERTPMLQRMLQYRYNNGELMPDNDIISECMGHLIAGADTTSTTLSYLFWELSRRADIMTQLRIEINDAMPLEDGIPDLATLQNLPYLDAFVKEGLRLYTAAPSLLERVVPESTSKSPSCDDVFDLMGYGLPPGTVVSTQAWSMHRDSSVFPSPDTFSPDRWLKNRSDSIEIMRMNQHMMPFGMGARICGGQNLAQAMIRVVVAALVRNFDFISPSETNEKSMDIRDSFVIFPAAMECKLVFQPRAHKY